MSRKHLRLGRPHSSRLKNQSFTAPLVPVGVCLYAALMEIADGHGPNFTSVTHECAINTKWGLR